MDLREKIRNVAGQINTQFWEIAPLLHECHNNRMYIAWGYDSFREYILGQLPTDKSGGL